MKRFLLKQTFTLFSLLFLVTILFLLSTGFFYVYADSTIENEVYLGGNVIGISINSEGLIITSKINVITKNGIESPFSNYQLQEGDILYAIDDYVINSIEDIDIAINNKKSVNIKIKRGKEFIDYIINPVIDLISNKAKIGLLLQDKILGIGTLTFIDPNSSNYYALGHPIKDSNGNSIFNGKGEIYIASVNKVIKPKDGKAGELNGIFNTIIGNIGSIDYSDNFGIYGHIDVKYDNIKKIALGNKEDIREGKAQIYSTLSGTTPKYYDIEITNIYKQNSREDKSMMIKVIDDELINICGGIVQGMSGSPIIQNGKLIGAVTHVMINEPTIGYGVFVEWMLNN